MKKKTKVLIFAIILSLAFLPQFNSLGLGWTAALQQPESAWVVWETGAPIQRVAWDGSALWAGAYKSGLSQWQLDAGQVAGYTTANGLSGNHVTSIAVNGSGQKWLALLDGSLNNTVNGSTFVNHTPAGTAGKNAWDVIANGNDIWLASLGGGVSRYSNGTWTTYNTSNSALPHNDVYAVAVDNSGTPWAGTVDYGVAALQNGDWVSYSLPVQIANPASQGTLVSNQAVTDIAIDSSGDKWFATDGSGVAMLDSSNTNWTVYNASNSELGSDFVHRIYIDPQGNLWFGTLSGGVSRLSADRTSWLTYNSSNSALPEDDILDVTTDAQGGLWLAAYDSGLAYYGSLPASAPTFEFDLFQKPDYKPGKVKGYYLWVDPATYEWTLAWSGDGKDHNFTGEILADSSLTYISDAGLETGDSAVVDGNNLTITASENSGEDSVTFKPSWDVTELTIRLKIDGAYYPYNIHMGGLGEVPGTSPFKVAAVQPLPPVVTAPADITIDEGSSALLAGEYTDSDSPIDHTVVWNLGDGNIVEDELFVDHIYPDNGSFTEQLTVTDIHGRVGTDITNITVQNVAPEVDFYYYPFVSHSQEEITFTGYFFDPGALDTHTITWNFGDGFAPLTTPELTVTHAYERAGTYTVTLTVTDDDGGVGVAVFNLEVLNDPPQFELGDDVTMDEGTQFTRSAAFTDPDSAQWELEVDYGDGSSPVNTTLNAEGSFDLDHTYVDNGIYTLTVSITDDAGAVTSDTILVTVQNVAPVVNAGSDQTIQTGSGGTVIINPGNDQTIQIGSASVNALYTDAGISDTHSATINWGDGYQETISTTVTGPGTGQVTSGHTYNSVGSFTVEVCVTDDDAGTGCDSMIIHWIGLPIATPTSTPTAAPTAAPTTTPTATQTPTETPTLTVTAADTTPIPTNTPTASAAPSQTFTPTTSPSQPNQPLYLSLNNAATVGGITAQDIDILYFDGTTWSMFFDGSDVGIDTSGQDLNEFHILDADSMLMTFDEPITLGTLAVDPWDVVRFDATSSGDNTAGMFSIYLDGNDIGLDTTNEYIDGLDVLSDGRVLISTSGNPSVPVVIGAADEDILAFTPITLGDITSGIWLMYFDGSDVGLADSGDEDVDALDVTPNGDIYLSTSGHFTMTGVSGFDEDVFICTPTSLGSVTACNYATSLYFDGSVYVLDANDVDGIDLTLP
ncbi:MAG: PKD domain-containing protein [Anaerolineae bacterium]|nr:PKD domain-containing protein [Anaerolineae bacterium]